MDYSQQRPFNPLAVLRRHSANIIAFVGIVFVLSGLFLLPQKDFWNIRLLLYLMVFIWSMVRPQAIFYLLPFAIPWGSLDTFGSGSFRLNSADILVGILTLGWLLQYVLHSYMGKQEARPIPRPLFLSICILLLAMLFSMIASASMASSLKEITKWIECFIVLFVGLATVRTRRQVWIIVALLLLAALTQAFFGYIQAIFAIGPASFIKAGGLRIYGTFDQPNPYAGYLNIHLSIALALILFSGSWKVRLPALLAAICLGIAIYLTQSRGGQIALGASVIFILVVGFPRLRPLFVTLALAVIVLMGAYFAGFIPERLVSPLLQKLGLAGVSLSNPTSNDFSTAERLAHWIAGLRMFEAHPILGVGIGNYSQAYSQFYITMFSNSLGHAHNYYINIAAEAGIVGLFAFLFFLFHCFRVCFLSYKQVFQCWQEAKQTKAIELERTPHVRLVRMLATDRALLIGLSASLLSICVHNFVDNLYVHGMTMLFALLVVLVIRIAPQQRLDNSYTRKDALLDYK